jgi:Ankyrin repeats (3 copies)/Prenyltransferase and squalene oxidase repeat
MTGKLKTMAVLAGASLFLHAQAPPDFTPPTPLFGAVMSNDTAAVKKLLAGGANPNEGRFLGVPLLFFAVGLYNVEAVDALIAAGADVKVTDGMGNTSLMFAAYNEAGDDTLVKRFLDLKVDSAAKNQKGETALQWAMRRGSTPAVQALQKAGANNTEMIRQSVEKAVALLQKSGPEFVKVSGCASCHNQSLPQMVYGISRARGLALDETVSDKQVKTVAGMYRPLTEMMAAGTQKFPNPPISVSYALLGLAAEGYPADQTTAAMAHLIATYQRPDGSFIVLGIRPPLEASTVSGTALSIRAIQLYGKDADAGERIKRAAKWLESAKTATGEDRSMRLLGLAWAKAQAGAMRTAIEEVKASQRADGGWAQLDGLETDAYATGMALVALETSGQVATTDPVYQRGVTYLLRTQLDDGSWLVHTRTLPLQPYKESGFPHGRHQWISAAGTSWAAMALGLTQPPAPRKVSQSMTNRSGE